MTHIASPSPAHPGQPVGSALRWAIYLGISWTWCIGMFLPALLVRDFGRWAFFAFAIPNILGAAGMGMVLSSADASRRMVERHQTMMVIFSRVTIAYQVFFAAWMLPQLIGGWTALLYPLIVLILIAAISGDRDFWKSACVVWTFSLACAAMLFRRGDLTLPPPMGVHGAGMIAPVCMFGFLLCPYLDLTFHRAFQRARDESGPAAARGAFGIGFVLVFGSMIALTFGYAAALLIPGHDIARRIIGFHILAQLAITITMHEVEARRESRSGSWLVVVAGSVLGLACYLLRERLMGGWQIGEYFYRLFLGMYGLVFPSYVLFKVLTRAPIPNALFYLTMFAALPSYAAGFMTLNPIWLIFGVATILMGYITSLWHAAYADTGRIA